MENINILPHSQYNKDIPDGCWQQIAQRTVEDQGFIDVLRHLKRDFCYHLNHTIISSDSQQEICKATTDSEAVHHIRMVRMCNAIFDIILSGIYCNM